MFRKLCFLISFVLVLSLASSTYALVQSDWEQTWDGWERRDSDNTDEIGPVFGTGAMLHDYGFKVEIREGWIQAVQLNMNTEPNLSIVLDNNLLAFNVTWVTADWPEGGTWAKVDAFVFNGDGIGWNQIDASPDGSPGEYCTDDANPNFQGGWDPINWGASHTRQMTFSYGQIDFSSLAAEPDYLQLIFCLHSGDMARGTFYFDNFRFFNTEYAYLPEPYDTQTGDPITTDLSWRAGVGAQYHDVYFGTSYFEVDTADNSGDPCATEVYRARLDVAVDGNDYDIPETLEYGKTYYWRIDEDTGSEELKGEIWSFTTQSKAREPYPVHEAIDVERSPVLSWRPGFPEAEHDVYIGTNETEVTNMDSDDPDPNDVYRGRQNADANTYPVPQALDMGQTYYWRIDEVNDTCSLLFEGDVWRFTAISGAAKAPYPSDGAEGIYINAIKLIWTAGPYAASHDVYFGTNYNDIVGADDNYPVGTSVYKGNQSQTEYNLSNIDLETTYYWRIDEVNESHLDVNWIGDVWSFTLSDYITIDDFEYYTVSDPEGEAVCPYYDGNDLRPDLQNDMRYWWLDGHFPGTSGYMKNPQGDCGNDYPEDYNPLYEGDSKLPGSRIILAGGQTDNGMSYFYDNNDVTNEDFPPENDAFEDHYSEICRYYADGIDFTPSEINADIAALELSYLGNGGNSADPVYDRMYIGLKDTSDNYAYIDHPDSDAALSGTWQQWAVKLSDFTDVNPSLNLNSIRSVRIGFGLRGNPYTGPDGGEGTVIFDNIRVFEKRCVRMYGPAGDFDGDCFVDLNDLSVMAIEWLFADELVEYPTTTEPAAPVLWYKFDETEGDVVKNWAPAYGSFDPCDFNGTVWAQGAATWDTDGGFDGSGCIYIPVGGNETGTCVIVPPSSLDFVSSTQAISFAIWVNADRDSLVNFANWPSVCSIWKYDAYISPSETEDEALEIQCPTPVPPAHPPGPGVHFHMPNESAIHDGDMLEYYEGLFEVDFAGRWNHYVFTKNADTDIMRIYQNGQLLAELTEADDPMFVPPVDSFYVGARHRWWGKFLGRLDDFRVYDYALSEEEAAYLADGNGDKELFLPLVTPSNLYNSDPNIIDLFDYAVLAENWFTEQLWP